jgi:hypothetical protein
LLKLIKSYGYFITLSVTDARLLLTESKDGRLHLKESHNYYHQVQGQLFLTDKKCCDLVVWTSKDVQVIRIARQESWNVNLSKMIKFYFDTFLDMINQ